MDGSREYDLFVRQQPKQARMCGVGADRRPIDPPPIVQLRVIDKARKNLPSPSPSPPPQHHPQPPSHPHGHTHESSGPLDASMLTPAGFGPGPFLQNPYYFMFASLAKPDDDTELHWMKDGKTRCTTGSVVSSLYHLKDSENDNRDAGFFVFPDLSVRQEGSYRLKLSLFEVVGSNVYHCKSIFSAPFYVYTAKKFPGMEESTPLSCSLADQGIKIRIRKDIRQRKPRSGITNFPIPNGQPLGPGIPIQDEESDRDSEARLDDHSDTTNNHNSLSSITTKSTNGLKRSEREPEKERERDLKRPRVDEEESEPAPNPTPSTGEWGIDPALAPGGSSSGSYDQPRSTASVPPPPPSAPGYPLPPPPQHHTYEPPPPPPQHHAPQPAHQTPHPSQHQPPHHYSAPPPPQTVHPTHHPTHPPPPPPYHTQYHPSSWPPQHPQHPPPHPHQYDHYSTHYPQYPPPPRYPSGGYDPYAPPPQQQTVPAYPGAAGYYAQYNRPGEAYGQYAPPPPHPPPPAPGPESNSASRNPPTYSQYQPPPPQQPPPPGSSSPNNPSRTPSYSYPTQPPPAATENSNYPQPPPSSAPAAPPSSAGSRASTAPTASAPPGGAASMYYQSHTQPAPAPRSYGTPPPNPYPPTAYHPQHAPPPPAHHASPPGHYAPYQHPPHPPPPHQGTWPAPSYAPAPAPAVYPGQSPNQNGAWENGAASGHSSVPPTTRESNSTAAPPANTSTSTGGPGLQLAPLRPRDDRGERERDPRDLKDDRERRKDDRETWGGRDGHGLGGGPSTLGGVNRPDRGRKRLSITSMLD